MRLLKIGKKRIDRILSIIFHCLGITVLIHTIKKINFFFQIGIFVHIMAQHSAFFIFFPKNSIVISDKSRRSDGNYPNAEQADFDVQTDIMRTVNTFNSV